MALALRLRRALASLLRPAASSAAASPSRSLLLAPFVPQLTRPFLPGAAAGFQSTAAGPDQCEPSGDPSWPDSVNRRPLVQVLSVRANFPVIGSIAVFDVENGQVIYANNQGQRDPDSQSQDFSDLVLIGPRTAISAVGGIFSFSFAPPESDGSINVRGKTHREFACFPDEVDYVVKSEITTDDGNIIKVVYAVLYNGIEAFVQVNLKLNADTAAPTYICGQITAHCQLYNPESVLLFSSEMDEVAAVLPSTDGLIIPIPLAQSAVAVPLSESLAIKVKLHAACPNHENIVSFDHNLVFSQIEPHTSWEMDWHGVALQVKITLRNLYY